MVEARPRPITCPRGRAPWGLGRTSDLQAKNPTEWEGPQEALWLQVRSGGLPSLDDVLAGSGRSAPQPLTFGQLAGHAL